MAKNRITLEEMYACLTAGGRNNGEKSNALESRKYGNPADTVEFPAERQRRLKRQKKVQPKYRIK